MSETGQAPERGQSGGFLNKASVAGRKVAFVQQSNFATASFTISANSSRNLTATLTINDELGNMEDFEEVVGIYHYMELFVDNNNDYAYEYAVGDSLSTGQKKITISTYNPRSGGSGSIRKVYHFQNNDSSDHTIYVESIWNYIEIA